MAIQQSVAVRNAMLEAIEATIGVSAKIRIFTGTQPANCAAAQTGTLLVEFALASDWAATAAAGSKALNAIAPANGVGTGSAGHYRLTDNGGSAHEQGSITVTGGGGDMTIDDTSITIGQPVAFTGWTWTQPGA